MTDRTPPGLTEKQRREVAALNLQAWTVRGVQLAVVLLGAGLAVFDGRGWPAFVIGCALAVWMQTQLPALPAWAEKLRPDDK